MLLSIITINRNNAAGLQKTLESMRAQGVSLKEAGLEIEHVIVDGASTDNSVDVIRQYEEQVKELPISISWSSEPDSGIYNGMNRGIRRAKGEYIQILNSADILAAPSVCARMLAALKENNFPEILYGNMLKVDANGKIVGRSGYTEYSLRQFYSSTLNHDCAYIKRSLFDKYGFYDEKLKIVSDWKWYLQAIGLGDVKPVYVNIDVTIFDNGGISETQLTLRNAERRQVLEEVMPPAILWDYDHHAFDAEQMNRLRRRHLYPLVYFMERVLFKLEKWHILR